MKHFFFTTVILGMFAHACAAETIVDLEIAIMPGAPITAPQEWAKRLGDMGIERVQIRSMHGEEKPSTKMSDDGTRVDVLAVLTGREELIFADRRFRVGQTSDLRTYLETLPEQIVEAGIVRGPFRLTEQEFNTVMTELGKPLSASTVGKTSGELLAAAETIVRLPIEEHAAARAILQASKPIAAELNKLSIGTALAIALRRDNLTIRPVHVDGGIELAVEPYQRGREVWPAGWKAAQSPRQVAPQLFESLNIEVDGYTLAKALVALEPRLRLPVILDEWVLAEQGIEPAKIPVKLPAKKTFLKNAVDKLLSQARLASEIRIDDAGAAFLWVTQYGPDSRPAP
jgi:hypothetical protein